MERALRREINRGNIRIDDDGNIVRSATEDGKKLSTRGLINQYGEANLRRALKAQKQAARDYERGNFKRGRARWEARDSSLPEWLYWYHGVFG